MPTRFNGTFITRHLFPDFFVYNNQRGINSGYCYDWAYYAHRLFNAQLWTTDYHAWVLVNTQDQRTGSWSQRFFDSETPGGVKNFMQLGCNVRHGPVPWDDHAPKSMGVQAFKKFWDSHGAGYRYHWDSRLETNLRKTLGKRFREATPIIPRKPTAQQLPIQFG
jgi:hypothetical protein